MELWIKKLIITIGVILILVVVIKYFFIYFSPFIIATVIAGLLNPVVVFIENKLNTRRGFAVFLVLTITTLILLLFIFLGLSQIYLELNEILQKLPDYESFGTRFQWFINQNQKIQELINNLELTPQIQKVLNENLHLLYNLLKEGLIGIINNLLNTVSKLPIILSVLLVSFVATFFISRDKDKINDFIMSLFPEELRYKVFNFEKQLVNSAICFIRAEVILITITGLLSWFGLIIIGNDYALVIGLGTALLDMIPIIGPSLIFIPWIIYNILTVNITNGISLLILYTFLAAVRQVAEGKIMGSSMGFHPLAIMISLYTGYRLFGTIGFLIGPTVLVISKAVFNSGIITIK